MSKQPVVPVPHTAIDFCTMLYARQTGRYGVQAVGLEPDEVEELRAIAHEATKRITRELSGRARTFLVIYREREKDVPVLSDEERAQLDTLLQPVTEVPRPTRPSRRKWQWKEWLIGAAATAVVVSGIGVGETWVSSTQTGPPLGGVQQNLPIQQVPPADTDLQNFKNAYGPFVQQAPSELKPQTGQPALLLLENNGYFASSKWTVSPTADGWHADISDNIPGVNVKGDYADISDTDGNTYIVGINQPFIVSSNVNTVLRIDPTGNVLAMTLAQATAVRQTL